MRHSTAALIAITLLAAACGDTTTTEAPAPDVTIQRPTTSAITTPTTQAPTQTTTAPATQTTESVPESIPIEPVECPEGTHAVDGACQPDTNQTPTSEAATPEYIATQEQCETAGGTWDDPNSECLPPDTAETPENDTLETDDDGTDEEPIAAQEQCETAGGTWDDPNSECLPPDTAETPEDDALETEDEETDGTDTTNH